MKRTIDRYGPARVICSILCAALLCILAPVGVSQGQEQSDQQEFVGKRTLPPEMMADVKALAAIADVYADASVKALEDGDYATAERAARNGLDVVPNDVRLLRHQGEALIRLRRNAEALKILESVSAIQPDQQTFARVALLMARVGKSDESRGMVAADLLESVLPAPLKGSVSKPNTKKDLEAYWALTIGLVSELSANDEQSLYYYTEARQLWPTSNAVNSRLGKVLLRNKRFSEAAVCFNDIKQGSAEVVAEARRLYETAKAEAKRRGTP